MTEACGNDRNTKDKILETANILFAKHGFGGASIRDIASHAGVNLSAVNYHFRNKENLYWRVFDYNYEKISLAVEKISGNSSNVEDMAVKVLEFYIAEGTTIMNTMKIFLSEMESFPEEELIVGKADNLGPPGQKFFLEKLRDEVPEHVSTADCQWAVNMIFCLISYIGLVLNTSLAKKIYKDRPEFGHANKKSELRRSVKLHIEHLKSKN